MAFPAAEAHFAGVIIVIYHNGVPYWTLLDA